MGARRVPATTVEAAFQPLPGPAAVAARDDAVVAAAASTAAKPTPITLARRTVLSISLLLSIILM